MINEKLINVFENFRKQEDFVREALPGKILLNVDSIYHTFEGWQIERVDNINFDEGIIKIKANREFDNKWNKCKILTFVIIYIEELNLNSFILETEEEFIEKIKKIKNNI